ncbi:MAG: MBL fold metallo-hydrolase, partial [Bdellovibrionales bacterium]|nr:MBL fold metallo-hydrolase [Bdellovibrionales bacterium]
MKLTLEFLGGAGTVTGSKFLLQAGDRRVLVDCGMFQGLKDLRLLNWASFPVPPSSIHAVLLTHAHLDHSGYLPLLARCGFAGPVMATAPTREISKVSLFDSAHIQEEDAEQANAGRYTRHKPALPLYTTEDAALAMRLFRDVTPRKWLPVTEGIDARFTNAGHILGSSIIEVRADGKTIAFTGDLGRSEPLLLAPADPLEHADYLVVESTY